MVSELQRFFYKRGVSPLIATVLLISFTVALGSVVLNWGKNLDISNSKEGCSGIEIEIQNIADVEVCYAGSGPDAYINFIISNSGNEDINGLGIWLVGEKGTKLLDLGDLSIKKGEILDIKDDSVKYDFNTYGKIKRVQFIPKIRTSDSIDICTRNSIEAKLIGIC